jgi:predicted metal-binding membrane protein
MTLARANLSALAALAALAAASWTALAVASAGMDAAAPLFLAGWALMMTAMMVPSAAPFVLLQPRNGRAELVAGYLLVWTAAGFPVLALQQAFDLMEPPRAAVAAVLAAAGLYQLTPVKEACLRRCRSPAGFLVTRWGRRPLALGVEHGVYCVGCCWALMALLVAAGAMALAWAAAIAVAVFVEKVLPHGDVAARLGGAALLAASALVLV